MNRDQIIADLVLHGYVPSANTHGWVAIWNGQTGRMCKYFEDGLDGPGWDVRGLDGPVFWWPLMSTLGGNHEVPWHRLSDDELVQLTAPELPPKYRHAMHPRVAEGFGYVNEVLHKQNL